ncbi:DsrE family protein [Flagellimonas meishanensis]|uniref:DsrE family protein n=1 Tax=Flagellimonas meishanensis TaxID=2873264 RepID=UPI001CA743B0|nr:DsrE family protein [[Muricauda] meishanensis]
MKYSIPFVSLFLLISAFCHSQEKSTGPILNDFGAVWAIENPDFKTDLNGEFKVVFDVMDSPESHSELNPWIETAARFLNMHAQAGVPLSQLKVALVVHNKASKDIANNEKYGILYGTENPNRPMIEALMQAGAEVIFCGQSSKSRGFPKEDLIPGTKMALSAMTALIQLQNEGYRLIKF